MSCVIPKLIKGAVATTFFAFVTFSLGQTYTLQTGNFTNTVQDNNNNNDGFAGFYNATGSSVGLYANGSTATGGVGKNPQDVAYHRFTSDGTNNSGSALSLQVGQSVAITFNLNGSQSGITGHSIGFSFNNGTNFGSVNNYNTGGRLEVSYTGGDSTAKIYDSSGATALSNVNFTNFAGGVTYTVTLISTNEYNFTDNKGDSFDISTLGGTSGNAIDSFSFFNRGWNNRDAIFTSMVVTNNSTIGYSVTSGSKNITGVINNNNGTANNIQKTGAGTLVLQNTNTFTGTTAIAASGGTLQVDNTGTTTGRLANTSGITVGSSGTLLLSGTSAVTDRINNAATMTLSGGTFNTGGLSEVGGTAGARTAGIGALTLTANSTINFGTGASIIEFAGLGSHTPTTGPDLLITNWTGTGAVPGGTDQLLFAGVTSDFTSQYSQSDVSFNGVSGYNVSQITANYFEVTAVPEPSTWVAAALSVATVGLTQRRRFTRLLMRGA